MKLLVLILTRTEDIEDILAEFANNNIRGATILSSIGMARTLSNSQYENMSFLGSLRAVLDPDRSESKTVITVIKDNQVDDAVCAIEKVVGDLSKPDTGIVFTVPVDFLKGINLK
ncbi:MAG: hypothetical protein RSC41_02915 [Oscillospiraceae bacterium]